jgi:hypothetical protein
MKRENIPLRLLWVTLFALFLSACGAIGAKDPIVGTWDIESGMKVTYQFRSNGTGSQTIMGHTAEGKYRYDGQQLEFISPSGEAIKYAAKVTNDELEITAEGTVTKFRRKN